MSVPMSGLVLAFAALVCLSGPSLADTVKPKHHHVAKPMAMPQPARWQGVHEDFFSGPAPDPGSDNRYFSDTRQPNIGNLGPGIFARWQ